MRRLLSPAVRTTHHPPFGRMRAPPRRMRAPPRPGARPAQEPGSKGRETCLTAMTSVRGRYSHTLTAAQACPGVAGAARRRLSRVGAALRPAAAQQQCGGHTRPYTHHELRLELIATALAMNEVGINQGTSGNISARAGEDGFLITPSGVPYDQMRPEQVVLVDLGSAQYYGDHLPSSEWRFHLDIYRARPEAQSILHAHSTYCTAVSALGEPIPAFHYMIASAGGKTIPCARYETFGTQPLSDSILAAMDGVRACLMANHGMICYDRTLPKALGLAVEVECLARQYSVACSLGNSLGQPVSILSDEEMDVILAKFQTYGKQPPELAQLMAGSAFLNEHAIIPPERGGGLTTPPTRA
jgi:L-fuculose-phosphate aldolase